MVLEGLPVFICASDPRVSPESSLYYSRSCAQRTVEGIEGDGIELQGWQRSYARRKYKF